MKLRLAAVVEAAACWDLHEEGAEAEEEEEEGVLIAEKVEKLRLCCTANTS